MSFKNLLYNLLFSVVILYVFFQVSLKILQTDAYRCWSWRRNTESHSRGLSNSAWVLWSAVQGDIQQNSLIYQKFGKCGRSYCMLTPMITWKGLENVVP